MKTINRRDLCISLLALTSMGGTVVDAQSHLARETVEEPVLSQSEVIPLSRMQVSKMPNGAESLNILHGILATGEIIALHESMQPARLLPNPLHTIRHSEFILVREGTLEFEHDGTSERVGAGGVIFVAFGTRHTARNVGDGPAKYFVIAIGGDTK